MIRFFAVLAALAALMSGCAQPDNMRMGSAEFASGSPAPATGKPGTSTETAFAKAMFAHDRQAIELDDLALNRSDASLEVRQIAAENKRAAIEESEQLVGWLRGWGQETPADSAGALGMLSVAQMAKVRGADLPAFDQLWMQATIAHHRGAVAMARQVQASVDSQEVVLLAQQIAASRQEVIRRLQILLANAAVQQVAGVA